MRRRRGPANPKKVSYELIPQDSVTGHPMYALLDELVTAHHSERDGRCIGAAMSFDEAKAQAVAELQNELAQVQALTEADVKSVAQSWRRP